MALLGKAWLLIQVLLWVALSGPAEAADKVGDKMKEKAGKAGKGMKECTADGKSRKECMEEVREAMKNHTKRFSNADLNAELEKAGWQDAGRIIKECMKAASNKAEKKACSMDESIREALANATGRAASDISNTEFRKAIAKANQGRATEFMKECFEDAGENETKVRECKLSLKDEIGEEASRVQELLREGAEEALLDALRSCEELTKQECKDLGREQFAKSMGKKAENISDFQLQRFAENAAMRRMSTLMKSCIEELGENASAGERADCKTAAREALQEANIGSDRMPTEAELNRKLKRAAIGAVLEVNEYCEDAEAVCKKLKLERFAAVLGKHLDNVTDGEVSRAEKAAALQGAQGELFACREASKLEGGTPKDCVKDSLEKFKKLKGEGNSTRRGRDQELKREMARSLEEGRREACYTEDATRETIKQCLEASEEVDEAMEEMYKDMPAEKRAKRKKMDAKNADVKVIGQQFKECKRVAADNETLLEECRNKAKSLTEKTDVGEDVEIVLQRYQASTVATSLYDCALTRGADLKECRREARAMAAELGFEQRKYAVMRRVGLVKQLAEVWAGCQEAGADNATCREETLSVFQDLTGSDANGFVKLAQKVERLAEALANGQLTELVRQKLLEVETGTSGIACAAEVAEALLAKLEAEKDSTPQLENITAKACQLTDGIPFYRFQVDAPSATDDQIEAAAASIATALDGVALNGSRRLSESVSEVNSAQGMDEVPAADAPTTSSPESESEVESTSSAPGSGGDSTAPTTSAGTESGTESPSPSTKGGTESTPPPPPTDIVDAAQRAGVMVVPLVVALAKSAGLPI